MTSASTYQGLGNESKISSRVLKPPGGSANDVLGTSQALTGRDHQANQRRVNERPETGYQTKAKAATSDSWNERMINKQRNMARDAPFATNSSAYAANANAGYSEADMSQYGEEQHQQELLAHDQGDARQEVASQGYESQQQAPAHVEGRVMAKGPVSDFNPINWAEREGEVAPMDLRTHENYAPVESLSLNAPVRMKGKAATHNPLTWEAYSNFDEAADGPSHKSRYGGHEELKKGAYNPITGEDYQGSARASPFVMKHGADQ